MFGAKIAEFWLCRSRGIGGRAAHEVWGMNTGETILCK